MTATTQDRLFIGCMPAGIIYSDRTTEEHGDYKKLAFLSYATLSLVVYHCPVDLLEEIRQNASSVIVKRGQSFEVSACGQTVTLGHDLTEICPKEINENYIHSHGKISQKAKDLCTRLRGRIESNTVKGRVAPGDIIVAHGFNTYDNKPVTYNNAHIENFGGWDSEKWHCCAEPSDSFISEDGDGFYLSTSGGYWFSVPTDQITHSGQREKTFWTWGGAPCAAGGVRFKALVNVWDYTNLDQIY